MRSRWDVAIGRALTATEGRRARRGRRRAYGPGRCDPPAQILVNLLTSAEKYGSGATGIAVHATDDDVTIRVADRGRGLPDELIERLFQRFSKGTDEVSRARGTGMGPFVVKTLAKATGGSVWYEANVPRGSVFAVRLPRQRTPMLPTVTQAPAGTAA